MRRGFFPAILSALVFPGAGQFYNRDFKKGAALLFLTMLLSISLFIGLGKDLLPLLPAKPSLFDPDQVRELREAMSRLNPGFYRRYSLILSLTWLFSVVDAFLGARERETGASK